PYQPSDRDAAASGHRRSGSDRGNCCGRRETGPTATAAASADSTGVYLALGDSIAFGARPLAVTPISTYLDARNFSSYANYTARATGLRLVNASCPYETTSTMMSDTATDFGCRHFRSLFPLHTTYSGPQLGYALHFLRTHPYTRLVSIDIGANDVFQCQATPGCPLPAAAAQAATNLAQILQRIRTEGGYRGVVVTLTYYDVPLLPSSLVRSFNAALATATRQSGGQVASGASAFEVAASPAGGDACRAGLLIPLPDGSCDIHPTAVGHLVPAVPVTLAYLRAREVTSRHAA
ncbi:MAG: SGNH/GDSL hydrolase family protein, partial [Frankiaceae bacterium]